MGKFKIEYFLAKRIAVDDRGDKNVMTRIASLSVGIGIAVMIISIAVILGFKNDITDKLTGFGANIQIVNLDGNTSYETVPISKNQPFTDKITALDKVTGMYPYAVKPGIIKTDESMQGVVLKGVDKSYDWSFFEKTMTDGEMLTIIDSARNKDVLISNELAVMLSLKVGDPFEMMFIQQPPRRDRFRVKGIYDTKFSELDKIMVVTDLRNVQRLSGWDSTQISGFEITTESFNDLDKTFDIVDEIVISEPSAAGDHLRVVSIRERYQMIFDWLDTHNINAMVIITVMLLVALFNMIAALLIILLERTSMIGTLKTLGMSNQALQKMFVLRSSYIILKGMIWGNIIGIALCLLQKYTGLVELDQSGYFLTTLPIYINWWYIALLNLATFTFIVLLLSLPTMIISLILPEKSLRYE